jgi:hypothetical protein
MFELQLQQANNIIARLQSCIEQGYDKVRVPEKYNRQEFIVWQETTGQIITNSLGINSDEKKRWDELANWEKNEFSKAITREGIGPLENTLTYMKSAIVLLNEFDAYLKQIDTKHPNNLQEAFIKRIWRSLPGKIFLLLVVLVTVIFAVWQSLPDDIKTNLLLQPTPVPIIAETSTIFPSVSDTPQLTFTPNNPNMLSSASGTPIQSPSEIPVLLTPQSTVLPLVITMPKDGASVTSKIDVFGSVDQSALKPGIYLNVIVIEPSDGLSIYYVQENPDIQDDGTWRSSPVNIGTEEPASSGKTFQICAVLHSQQLKQGEIPLEEIPSFNTSPHSCIKVKRE